MNKQVLKFSLTISDKSSIEMFEGAEVLCILTQNNQPMVYALCNPEAEKETRHFEVFGTGHPIGYDMGVDRKFIGSFKINNEQFVGHVFERIN